MGFVRKALHSTCCKSRKTGANDFKIPLKDSTLENIITLKDIDLKVKKGQFVVIIGDTGSGKSNLLNTIIGEMIYLP